MHKEYNFTLLLVLITVTILILLWFRVGLPIGGAEVGIYFFKQERGFQIVRYAWNDIILGDYYPYFTSSALVALFSSLLEKIAPLVVIQALWLFLLLAIGAISVYELTLMSFKEQGKKSHIASTISALFYILNPYSMSEIFRRFLVSQMFGYALFPLVLMLMIKGLRKHKLRYAFLIATSSLPLGIAFGTAANMMLTFGIILSCFLFYLIFNLIAQRPTDLRFLIKYTLATVIFMILVNLWWLLPFAFYSISHTETLISPEISVGIMRGISQSLRPIDVISLVSHYYTYIETSWGSIYQLPLFYIVPIFIPLIASLPLLRLRNGNELTVYFLIGWPIMIFLSKGGMPPFEEATLHLFEQIPMFLVFRNPFEKFGILLPLFTAPLFGIGSVIFFESIVKHLKIFLKLNSTWLDLSRVVATSLTIFLIILQLGVYVWPMWTGSVFSSPYIKDSKIVGIHDYHVKLPPAYYQEANEWIINRSRIDRILMLPMVETGILYDWGQHSYGGVDISNYLFDRQTISMLSGSYYNNLILINLNRLAITRTDFWKVMAILNARYLIVRHDVNYTIGSQLLDGIKPSTIEEFINGIPTPGKEFKVIPTDKLDNWNVWVAGYGRISLDNNDFVRGNTSIQFSADSTSESWFTAVYWFDNITSLYPVKFLDFWLKADRSIQVGVVIFSKDRSLTSRYYEILPQNASPNWTHYTILLDPKIMPGVGSPDISQATGIGIAIGPLQKGGNYLFKINDVKIRDVEIIKQIGLYYTKSFGKLNLYEIDQEYFLPRIYVVTNFTFAKDIDDFLFDLISSNEYDPRKTVVFLENQLSDDEMSFLKSLDLITVNRPKITIDKFDPTKWIINVQNATAPFILVFSETYRPEWKAYYGDVNWIDAFFLKPIPDNYHFIANGYANAWYINRAGTYTITLYFQPQSYLNLGTLISITTLIIATITTLYLNREKLREKLASCAHILFCYFIS